VHPYCDGNRGALTQQEADASVDNHLRLALTAHPTVVALRRRGALHADFRVDEASYIALAALVSGLRAR
jgi:hypothetical protein